MSGNGKRPYPKYVTVDKRQPQLEPVLIFCRQMAITRMDPDTNALHERATWHALAKVFAPVWPTDWLDWADDHYTAIVAAMYAPTDGNQPQSEE